jgi:Ca2+-binding EF-hand superfamily protein
VINNTDLNPLQVYKLFDPPKERTAGIGANNIQAAFKKLGIPIDINNTKIIIKRFDCNRDGFLTYTEVCEFFKPKDIGLSNQFI